VLDKARAARRSRGAAEAMFHIQNVMMQLKTEGEG
jgi:hypothetical protein